jgi:very-short-patch-repair endonuclease
LSTINQFKRATARRLRKNATDSEVRLWRYLKRLKTRGTHFRRQMPIGKFVVDFACPAARLIIEVDGSQHGEGEARLRDQLRTEWLESEGYRVLRFWNNEITQNIHGVMDAVYVALYGTREAEARVLRHERHTRKSRSNAVTPPRRAMRADPPPPGEGEE